MRKRILIIIVSFIVILAQINCKTSSEEDSGISVIYYLIGEVSPNHMDSYILPLSDPNDITTADNIISGISRNRIVVATIGYGSGDGVYMNKDLTGSGNRIWSWHILKFENFADVTAEIYDGWPGYLEDNLSNWLATKSGIIGFWNYTVKRRVDIAELQ
ncbi:MAG: hypothetical protein KAR14_09075 [Candidatus Aminicenantes bacterium]|nr:hypothetical protein [Candidatus Aminicenantes bacterium]